MGYQESYVLSKFPKDLIDIIRDTGSDYYDSVGCWPKALITFKKDHEPFKKGDVVVYFTGERNPQRDNTTILGFNDEEYIPAEKSGIVYGTEIYFTEEVDSKGIFPDSGKVTDVSFEPFSFDKSADFSKIDLPVPKNTCEQEIDYLAELGNKAAIKVLEEKFLKFKDLLDESEDDDYLAYDYEPSDREYLILTKSENEEIKKYCEEEMEYALDDDWDCYNTEHLGLLCKLYKFFLEKAEIGDEKAMVNIVWFYYAYEQNIEKADEWEKKAGIEPDYYFRTLIYEEAKDYKNAVYWSKIGCENGDYQEIKRFIYNSINYLRDSGITVNGLMDVTEQFNSYVSNYVAEKEKLAEKFVPYFDEKCYEKFQNSIDLLEVSIQEKEILECWKKCKKNILKDFEIINGKK